MRLSRLLVIALPLTLLGAKSGKKAEPPPADTGSAPSAAPTAPTAADATAQALSTMKLTAAMALLDAGAEPRTAVRFAPTPGAVTTSEMTQSMTMSMDLNGQTMPMPASGTVTTTRTTVGQRDASGAVPIRTEILGIRATGAAAGPTPAITGMVTELVVNPDGTLGVVDVSGGNDAAAAMARQMAEQTLRSLQAFPAEPIGVGARWTTSIDTAVAGISLLSEATSTVRAIHDDALDIDVTLSMKPGSTTFQFPGMPPGASMELTKFAGTATGTQHVDLTRMVTSFTQDMHLDMDLHVSMPEGGPPGGVALSMHMDMAMKGEPVATP